MRNYRASGVAASVLVVLASACVDSITDTRTPTPPPPPGVPGRPVTIEQVACVGNLTEERISCGRPAESGASQNIIVGGQNLYVTLTSTNVSYNGGTGQFTFDVTIESLIEQPIGTTDGVALDPGGIRIFFHDGPDVLTGTGSASVVPDGFDTFTEAGQAFYQYNEVLEQNGVSAARTWTLIMPPTVGTFAFQLYVSAPVQYPDGYITLDGELPGADHGPLHPGDTHPLAAVIKSAVGNTLPGTVTFGSTDPQCLTVDSDGIATGVRAGNCSIAATSGSLAGSMWFDVTGTVRIWEGDVSSDWSDGDNWALSLVPAEVDSVSVPFGVPNYPALVGSTTIGGVEVADQATLSLDAFDLSIGADVATGATPGGGILATGGRAVLAGSGSARGRLPQTLIAGTYALSGDLFAVATQTVDSGTLDGDTYTIEVNSQ